MRVLIVTAVDAEADAIGAPANAVVVAAGIGRTNAAACTTEAIIRRGPFDAVLSAGVAGALPGGELEIGEVILATACVYAEEGLMTPDGFGGMAALGLRLGGFDGNDVPVDPNLRSRLESLFTCGRIATVATCSGTDAQAALAARRTGARAEAMEGAAVVHAASRLGVPGIELRAISNTTGDRPRQVWDLAAALSALGPALRRALAALSAG